MIGEVARELFAIFFGAPRLSLPILLVIAGAAALARFVNPQLAGAWLLLGCLAALAENVIHTARGARR